MDIIEIAAIIVTGAVGCAEFGSATMVHPVIRKLSVDEQLVFEKGLLTTFGRVMPIGMTAAVVLGIILAIAAPSGWLITAAVSLGLALAVSIIVYVPFFLLPGMFMAAFDPIYFFTKRL